MVLPPIESTPVVVIRFTDKSPADLVAHVKERLAEGGLLCVSEESTPGGDVLLGITTSHAELEAEAEHIRLVKRRSATISQQRQDHYIMDLFTVDDRKEFLFNYTDDEGGERDSMGLFCVSEWGLLVHSILDEISILAQDQITSNLSRKLDELKVPYMHAHHYVSRYDDDGHQILDDEDTTIQQRSESLTHVLMSHGYIDVVTPVHVPHLRDRLLKQTLRLGNLIPPIEAIRDYYGTEIAFYFAWMSHYTIWLIFPGLLGLIVFTLRKYRGISIENDTFTPFYGIVTFVWSILFYRFWERTEVRLAYRWGTMLSQNSGYEQKFFNARPEYRGVLRRSPVTGRMETYYPAHWRRLKYFGSGLITVALLGVAFSVMIMSLNLQGYIRPKNDPERWTDEHPHPFHYPFLSVLAEEGSLFDAASQWRCFIPVGIHVMCIMIMNALYRKIAEALTEWENHETENDFSNSLILKRFLFEAFDCYIALFYLAFYERDVDRLRAELVSVFTIDTFRRILLECILPSVIQRLAGRGKHEQMGISKKFEDSNAHFSYSSPLVVEASGDEYEQFDDYMEMVIELGYVSLFASAFPLASLIAIVAHLVEIRSDFFKISILCQRPRSIRTGSIGMWKNLISGIIWLSALTNCLIFGFTSQQLMEFIPGFYYVDDMGHMKFVPGKGWIVVFIIFGLERILLYAGIIINNVVPDIPEDILVELERRQFVKSEETKALRITEELVKERERQRDSIKVSPITSSPFMSMIR